MHRNRSWARKFRDAFRGVWLAVRGERSFAVHVPMATAVVVAGIALRVSLVEWCVLGLCIALVLAAETFNTALEHLAREIDRDHNPNLATALDIGSGAVLLASIGAAIVGSLIFVYRLGTMASWWS
jgi:diacylglycerol kinase